MAKWVEIQVALAESRCELVLSGPEISARIEEEGGVVDEALFSLSKLNYLEINRCASLASLPDSLGQLSNLTKLSLHSNALVALPDSLGRLRLLRILDVSRNALQALPEGLNALAQLHTLNASGNRLTDLPAIGRLVKLTVLDISHNGFTRMPGAVLDKGLEHLAEIRARGNRIDAVPAALAALPSLKVLDVEDNAVETVAGELGDAAKLKEVFLNGNPLADRRLLKMVAQCHHKQVIEYVRAHCPREAPADPQEGGGKGKNKKKKKKGKGGAGEDEDGMDKILDSIHVLRIRDDTPTVLVHEATKDVRPYIVCCIIRDMDLQSAGNFKKFISLQTRLHDNECAKRTVATIATHDLGKVGTNLVYDARPPSEILIRPISRPKSVSALELFNQLKAEADALRKEKKRNTYSGIHKFLHLLDEKPLFPCLVAQDGQIISFPPITNSDVTKIGPETKDVFVEVTGTVTLRACKEVLEALLRETLKLDLHRQGEEPPPGEESGGGGRCVMRLQQVKVVNHQHQLKVVYPAQPDLTQFPPDTTKIVREEDVWPDIKQQPTAN